MKKLGTAAALGCDIDTAAIDPAALTAVTAAAIDLTALTAAASGGSVEDASVHPLELLRDVDDNLLGQGFVDAEHHLERVVGVDDHHPKIINSLKHF